MAVPKASTASQRILELRIHGVNNTSPASMLDLPEDNIERVLGDELSGFWRMKQAPLVAATVDARGWWSRLLARFGGGHRGASPLERETLGRDDRGSAPSEVTREAYSWGGLARNTPDVGGTSALGSIGRAAARVGWVMLLPFGLANVAYWTRRLGVKRGAGTIRIFSVGLTLLAVFTACGIAMDLVAAQCYKGGQDLCRRLPDVTDVLAARELSVRIAISSLLPLVLLLGLWILSSVSRRRYERAGYEVSVTAPADPILATPGFWSGDSMVGGLGRLHLAAGIAAIALALSWPAVFGTGPDCATPRSLISSPCLNQAFVFPDHLLSLICIGLAVVALMGVLFAVAGRSSDAPDVPGRPNGGWYRLTTFLLVLSGVTMLLGEGVLIFAKPELDEHIVLPGVSAMPTVVAIALLGIAAGALTWRVDRRWWWTWAWLVSLSIASTAFTDWGTPAAVVVLLLLFGRLLTASGGFARKSRRRTAWGGTAPGVILGAALFVAFTLWSLVSVGAGDWLNGGNTPSSLVAPDDGQLQVPAREGAEMLADCGELCPPADPRLVVPMPYVLFGAGAVITLVLLLLIVVAILAKTSSAKIGPAVAESSGQSKALRDQLLQARRFAATAHRAEKLMAVLVWLAMAAAFAAVLITASGHIPWRSDWGFRSESRALVNLGTAGVAIAGVALLAGLAGGAAVGKSRPLGLVWDLICFLPRAAHPFGPPCYAERAVPEIVERCRWWLAQESVDSVRARRGDTIVLSAHSLGSVLAVAALFALSRPNPDQLSQGHPERGDVSTDMRLLTYGSQLRAYFGRIFPELLGPSVLGTTPISAAMLWAPDPWKHEVEQAPTNKFIGTSSLVAILGGRTTIPNWRNLWRRTDYLGFPVNSYLMSAKSDPENYIDWPAEELDESGYLPEIATHGNYPRSPAYDKLFRELTGLPPTSEPSGTPG
ncbi:MAG: hypothetical protein H0T54_06885 [Geodermatophilaceae bacterium]|nr:hypothetical protein [Geodermatophilaceae bacterium]